MSNKTIATLAVLASILTPSLAGADEGRRGVNHGYGGGGLMLGSNTLEFGTGSSIDSSGFGLFAAGAGLFNVSDVVGIGVNGGFLGGERTYDNSDVEATEGQFAVDGGAVFFDALYVSLGLQSYAFTVDFGFGDETTSYVVVPLGIGVYKAADHGYLLAQLRFGGGTATYEDDTEEDLGFVGLRVMGQIGAENGVQFLGGMELESYDLEDSGATDDFFRLFVGVAFGT